MACVAYQVQIFGCHNTRIIPIPEFTVTFGKVATNSIIPSLESISVEAKEVRLEGLKVSVSSNLTLDAILFSKYTESIITEFSLYFYRLLSNYKILSQFFGSTIISPSFELKSLTVSVPCPQTNLSAPNPPIN